MEAKRFFLGITGASGAPYGVRVLRALADLGHEIDLAITDAGFKVIGYECGVSLNREKPDLRPLLGENAASRVRWYPNDAIESPPSSGTFKQGGALIVPCSMGTMGRVAAGFSSCLIERCADVALKERRPLVIVPRETPLNAIHLRNMLRLSRAGTVILPAMPGFYHRPKKIEDLVDHVAAKALDALGVSHSLIPRWGSEES